MNYTMRRQLLPEDTPVAKLVCLHTDPVRPLQLVHGLKMNWQTGLVHHICGLPILEMVETCWGCEKQFWGMRGEGKKGCIECKDYM